MIAAWLSKAAKPLMILLALMAAAVFLFWLTLFTVHSMIETARTEKGSERDAFWTALIEKSNAETAAKEAAQAAKTMRISAETAKIIADQRARLLTLEKANAALPNGNSVGLDRGRVQLLPD